MKNSCRRNRTMRRAVGFALTIGGGILVAKYILNNINKDKETYSVTVNFDENQE